MFNKDYEQLYYKYKTKYLNLKKELYGGKNKTFNEHLEEYINKNFPNTPPFPNTDPDWIENFREDFIKDNTDVSGRISEIEFGNLLNDFNFDNNNVVTESLRGYYLTHHMERERKQQTKREIVNIIRDIIPQENITNMKDLHNHFNNPTHRNTMKEKGPKNQFHKPPQRPETPIQTSRTRQRVGR